MLEKLLANSPPDFIVLASSISAFLGEFGQVDYCAANAFLDAFAQAKACTAQRVISINWDTWEEVGMAVEAREAISGRSQQRRSETAHSAPRRRRCVSPNSRQRSAAGGRRHA